MDISRRTLLITFIINILLIAISIACVFVSKYNTTVLWLSVATVVLVLVSSFIIWKYARDMRR